MSAKPLSSQPGPGGSPGPGGGQGHGCGQGHWVARARGMGWPGSGGLPGPGVTRARVVARTMYAIQLYDTPSHYSKFGLSIVNQFVIFGDLFFVLGLFPEMGVFPLPLKPVPCPEILSQSGNEQTKLFFVCFQIDRELRCQETVNKYYNDVVARM